MRRCLSVVLFGCCVSAVLAADDRPSDAAIREAITVLEARLAQTGAKEDKDRIGGAIAGLEKLLPPMKDAGGKVMDGPELAKLLTPARLAKKLAGRAAFNAKTGELTLVYDFTAKDQLRDFDAGEAKPKVQRGGVTLDAGEELTHKVEFLRVRLTTQAAVKTLNGSAPVRAGGGVRLKFEQHGGGEMNRILIAGKGNTAFEIRPTRDIAGVAAIDLSIGEQRCVAKVGETTLSKDAKVVAGQMSLHGGTGGATFGKLTLVGTLDAEWAAKFFAD